MFIKLIGRYAIPTIKISEHVCEHPECNNITINLKYCSRRCTAKMARGIRRKPNKCKICYNITSAKVFCSAKCQNEWRWQTTIIPSILEGRCTQKRTIMNYLMKYKGHEYRCEGINPITKEQCTITNEWMEQNITLQIDHINGNRLDNSPLNLRLLCPNCHTQTPTFAGKNRNALE